MSVSNEARPAGNFTISLAGHTALITGASRGMGLAMSQRFAGAGATVVMAARRPDVLEEARAIADKGNPGKVFAYPCDVSDAKQIDALFAKLRADGHEIDILVNNAGASSSGPFEQVDDAMWQEDLDLKFFAAIRTCRHALPAMKAKRWGRILNVVSSNGKAPREKSAPTGVVRAAGIALTKVLASEFAPYNILVNALCTGLIMSDQVVRRWETTGKKLSFEAHLADESKAIPLGRFGTEMEFANVACLLASDAGGYVTGTAINIDGGRCPVW